MKFARFEDVVVSWGHSVYCIRDDYSNILYPGKYAISNISKVET